MGVMEDAGNPEPKVKRIQVVDREAGKLSTRRGYLGRGFRAGIKVRKKTGVRRLKK